MAVWEDSWALVCTGVRLNLLSATSLRGLPLKQEGTRFPVAAMRPVDIPVEWKSCGLGAIGTELQKSMASGRDRRDHSPAALCPYHSIQLIDYC